MNQYTKVKKIEMDFLDGMETMTLSLGPLDSSNKSQICTVLVKLFAKNYQGDLWTKEEIFCAENAVKQGIESIDSWFD